MQAYELVIQFPALTGQDAERLTAEALKAFASLGAKVSHCLKPDWRYNLDAAAAAPVALGACMSNNQMREPLYRLNGKKRR